MNKFKEICGTEDKLQAFVYKTFYNKLPEYRRQLFSVPNGGSRHILEANKLKATGLVPGIPDMIFYSSDLIIFFEFKQKDGKLSPGQIVLKQLINSKKIPYFLVRKPNQFFYGLLITLIMRKELSKKQASKLMKAFQDDEGLIFFGLTEEQFEYEVKVFRYIFECEIGVPENIIELTSEQTRNGFINTLKKFIHLEFDFSNGFQLTFSEDFSSFVKTSIKLD